MQGSTILGNHLSQTILDGKAATTITVNTITGTTYTVQSTDNGCLLYFTNSAAITLTVPSGLLSGFNFTVLQGGTGQITPTASGTTLVNVFGHTKTYGQWAMISFVSHVTDNFVFGGSTVA